MCGLGWEMLSLPSPSKTRTHSCANVRERVVTANIGTIRPRGTVNFVNFPSGNFQQPDRSSLFATLLLR